MSFGVVDRRADLLAMSLIGVSGRLIERAAIEG
jgi:hypothetical protein